MTHKQWREAIIGDVEQAALIKYDNLLRRGKLKVIVKKVTEMGFPARYAIIVEGTTHYIDAFKTKKEALALCKACGWKVYVG